MRQNTTMKKTTLFLLFAICILASSCKMMLALLDPEAYYISIDSYSHKKPLPMSYTLVCKQDSISSYLKSEVENYLEYALGKHQLVRVAKQVPGSMIIEYDLGTTQIEKEVTSTYPLTRPTYTSTSGNSDGVSTYTTSEIYGYDTYQRKIIEKENFFELSAYVSTPSNDNSELWMMILTTRSGHDDLRKMIPYMLTASINYINTNTNGKTRLAVYSRGKDYKRMLRSNN